MATGEAERSEILNGKEADQVAVEMSPVETSLVETESVGSTMSEASPPGQPLSSRVGSAPPASKSEPAPQQYAVVIRDGEVVETDPDLVPAPQKAQPAPSPRLSERPSPGKQAEAEPKKSAPTQGSAAPEPYYSGSSETEVPAAPVSEHAPLSVPSVSEGEGVPTGSPAPAPFEEDPDAGIAPPSPSALIEPVEQQALSEADLVAGPVSSRMLHQTTPPPVQEGPQQPLPVSSAVEAASSGAGQATLMQTLTTVADAAASVLETLGSWTHYSPSGETTESPLEGTAPEPLAPQLPSPFEGSSVFSSSGVFGQTGPWGGYVVLLLGVLVSGLVLLLRNGLLCWAAWWEQPKPSSALLLPLERPG